MMNTIEAKLQSDLTDAIKERNENKANALRSIKTAIMEMKTAKNGNKNPDDAAIIKLIQKLAKERKEVGELYKVNGREDLADIEFAELETLNMYLPKMLTEDEVVSIVDKTISELGATTMKDMGKVMASINKNYAGQVGGGMVSKIVKAKLS